MSLFDNLEQMAGNELAQKLGAAGQGHTGVAGAVMEMIQSPQIGGVSGLVRLFESQGLGGIAHSWIGNGPNQQISGEQVQQALGQNRIQELAGKFGIPPQAASGQLATLLPTLIDKLTPNGRIEGNQ